MYIIFISFQNSASVQSIRLSSLIYILQSHVVWEVCYWHHLNDSEIKILYGTFVTLQNFLNLSFVNFEKTVFSSSLFFFFFFFKLYLIAYNTMGLGHKCSPLDIAPASGKILKCEI